MRAWFCFFLVIFSQLSFSWARSRNTVALAPSAPYSDFKAFLRAHPESVSLAEHQFRSAPASSEAHSLFEDFKQAQQIFFSDSKSKAREAYTKIIARAGDADWKPTQRKILFTAALRAAELSQRESEKQLFLLRALSISVVESPDPKVFPPPLIESFEFLKKQTLQIVSVPDSLKDAEILSVAGQVVRIGETKTLQLPSVPTLAVAYSSRWNTLMKSVDSESLPNWQPEKSLRFSDTCEPKLAEALIQNQIHQLYVDHQCVIDRQGKNIFATERPLQLQVQKAVAIPSSLAFNQTTAPAKDNAWWKNKWLWMGLAGAGAVYLIHENNKNGGGNGSNPTTVYE